MYAKKGLFKTFEEMDGTEEYQIIGFLEVLIGMKSVMNRYMKGLVKYHANKFAVSDSK